MTSVASCFRGHRLKQFRLHWGLVQPTGPAEDDPLVPEKETLIIIIIIAMLEHFHSWTDS